MKQWLFGGKIWMPDHSFSEDSALLIDGDRIAFVGKFPDGEKADRVIDLSGKTVIPGLVDAHSHGRDGCDFSTASESQLRTMRASYAKMGVTTVVPTLASAPLSDWCDAVHRIERVGFDAIHLEGNYLNPSKRGAHPIPLLRALNAEELEALLSEIRLPCHLTAAFELDADGSFAETALRHGVTMGLGHTNATAEQARAALANGVTSFTHLYNAMPPLHHREGGAVSVAFNGDAYAELIVDGVHVCPDMVRLAYRCVGPDRLVLITDSMEATGCVDGNYTIAGQPVVVRGGKALTLDGALAGSTLDLLDGLKNLMRFADVSLADAVACATLNPARMLGIDASVGSLETGKRADLLVLDDGGALLSVMTGGIWGSEKLA